MTHLMEKKAKLPRDQRGWHVPESAPMPVVWEHGKQKEVWSETGLEKEAGARGCQGA